MTRRRWFGAALAAATAVSVISAGASALAASAAPHTNYRGSARPAHATRAVITSKTNHSGPARGAAPAAADASSATATTVIQHYSLAASAYAPDGLHDTADDYFNEWDPSTLSNSDTGRCFNTGLSLPPKAHLKSITVYYTAGSNVMFFEINEQALATHTATELVNFDTTVATGTPTYTSTTETFPANTVVNMAQDAYSSGVCPDGTTTFTGFTITYTVPA